MTDCNSEINPPTLSGDSSEPKTHIVSNWITNTPRYNTALLLLNYDFPKAKQLHCSPKSAGK